MSRPTSRAQLEADVLEVLRTVSPRPIEPTLESDLGGDLGFDSLLILVVIAELEDRFDVSIPLNDVPLSRKVNRIVAPGCPSHDCVLRASCSAAHTTEQVARALELFGRVGGEFPCDAPGRSR